MSHDNIPSVVSDCSLIFQENNNGASNELKSTCLSSATLTVVSKSLGTTKSIDDIKNKTNCPDDKCIIQVATSRNLIDKATANREIANLKIEGPTDNKLLSNINIDSILHQWQTKFTDFYAYNFNMLNYMDYSFRNGRTVEEPDTLATVSWNSLKLKYKCAGCVINSDVYQGGGKHWMALFADWRDPAHYTIEFFNSSGYAPAPEWVAWMEKIKSAMEITDKTARIECIRVSQIRHQKSKSECGLYSLYYIWSRLNGKTPDFFKNNKIEDKLMFEFRQHLFTGGHSGNKGVVNGKFDWQKFTSQVDVKWE